MVGGEAAERVAEGGGGGGGGGGRRWDYHGTHDYAGFNTYLKGEGTHV